MSKVYLAGPEVFLPDAAEIGRRKKAICARYGLEGLFPLDKEVEAASNTPYQFASAIYQANISLMLSADAIIANMTPFRGPSMDVGTAFEIGFCTARNLPVFGYANVSQLLVERIEGVRLGDKGTPIDQSGMDIENFQFFENLMVEIPARHALGQVITANVPSGGLFTDLSVFEKAVSSAAAALAKRTTTHIRTNYV